MNSDMKRNTKVVSEFLADVSRDVLNVYVEVMNVDITFDDWQFNLDDEQF